MRAFLDLCAFLVGRVLRLSDPGYLRYRRWPSSLRFVERPRRPLLENIEGGIVTKKPFLMGSL